MNRRKFGFLLSAVTLMDSLGTIQRTVVHTPRTPEVSWRLTTWRHEVSKSQNIQKSDFSRGLLVSRAILTTASKSSEIEPTRSFDTRQLRRKESALTEQIKEQSPQSFIHSFEVTKLVSQVESSQPSCCNLHPPLFPSKKATSQARSLSLSSLVGYFFVHPRQQQPLTSVVNQITRVPVEPISFPNFIMGKNKASKKEEEVTLSK